MTAPTEPDARGAHALLPGAERTPAGDEALLEDWVAAWLEADAAGRPLDPVALCSARPDLLPVLQALIGLAEGLPTKGPSPPTDPLLGRTLGARYRLTARLGAGGMGMVYAARDEQLGRDVAVKVLDELFAADPERVERFRREAQSLAALADPHIVAVHDFELSARPPYLVMDRVVGLDLAVFVRSLRDHVSDGLTPTPAQVRMVAAAATGVAPAALGEVFSRPWPSLVAALALQMANALQRAHEVGVVHRDVKPSNFMVDVAGRVRLLDFGLARRDVDVTLTRSDTRVGTPLYMSPEQVRGEEATAASDLYSLGATLYELACLRPPFEGRGSDLERRILHDEPTPPQRVRSRLPRDLGAVALAALHKTPARRYASAAALADDLARFLRFEPVAAQTRVLPEPLRRIVGTFRRYRRAAAVVALVVLGMSVVALAAGRLLGEREGRVAAAATHTERRELHARLSPYLGFGGGRDDRLAAADRPAQLALLDRLLELAPDDAVARFLRLWVRGEEDPPPAVVAADRQRLAAQLGPERFALLHDRVAVPLQRRDRTDPVAGRDAMLAALAALDASRPLDALVRRLRATVVLQLVEFDRDRWPWIAEEVRGLVSAEEQERGPTAFTCLARGTVCQLLGDNLGARDALLACDRLCPGQPSTVHGLARVLRQLGETRRALDLLEPVLAEQARPHVNLLELHAYCAMAVHDFAAADATLRRFPDDGDSQVRAVVARARMAMMQAVLAMQADTFAELARGAEQALNELRHLEAAGRLGKRHTALLRTWSGHLAVLRQDSPAAAASACLDLLRSPHSGRFEDPFDAWLLQRLGHALERAAGDDPQTRSLAELLAAMAAKLERLERDGVSVR